MSTSARPSPRRPGRPPRVSIDGLVAAAVAVGLEDFTMQGIARHLGVTSQALYRWVADREELLDMVADNVVAQIVLPPVGDVPDWRTWLPRFGHVLRDALAGWPGIAARSLTRHHVSVAFVRLHAGVIEALVRGGLPPARAIKVAEIFGTCVLGWISREQALTGQRKDGRKVAEEIRAARAAAGLTRSHRPTQTLTPDERFDELLAALVVACQAVT